VQPTTGSPEVLALGAQELSRSLLPELSTGIGAAAAARFDADTLIDLCVLAEDVDLRGLALRDAEIALLIDAASGQDEVRARLAARALRRNDGPISVAAAARLVQALVGGPDFLKIAAADLLDARCIARESAIAGLVRALGESDAVAAVAAESLRSHGEAAARALAGVLADGPAIKRRRAIETLASMKAAGRPAAAALLPCVSDPDPEIAKVAAWALFSILTDGEVEDRLQRLEGQR